MVESQEQGITNVVPCILIIIKVVFIFMADFKSMYYTLVRAQLKAIHTLESALLDTEKLFEQTALIDESLQLAKAEITSDTTNPTEKQALGTIK